MLPLVLPRNKRLGPSFFFFNTSKSICLTSLGMQQVEEVVTQPAHTPSAQRTELAASYVSKSAPKNSFEFEKDWKQVKDDSDALYQLLKNIKAEKLSEVIQESLSGDKLGKMVTAISRHSVV